MPEAHFPRSPFAGNWVAEYYECRKLGFRELRLSATG